LTTQVLRRSALVLLALLAISWLALSLRGTRLEAQGGEVVDQAQRGEISRDELDAGLEDLRRARRFNADKQPILREAALLADAGRHQEAVALAEEVVASEPENLDGWILLYLGALVTDDKRRAARALGKLQDLNPQLGDRLRDRLREGP
jgi:hypothetical protein